MIFTLCDYFKALKSEKHAAAKLLLLMICQSFNEAMLQTFKQPQKSVEFVATNLFNVSNPLQTCSQMYHEGLPSKGWRMHAALAGVVRSVLNSVYDFSEEVKIKPRCIEIH